MSSHSQRSKSAKMPTVLKRQETERYDHEQDGFLVHMPAEQKGGITTQRDGTDESIPRRPQEQLDEGDLRRSVVR